MGNFAPEEVEEETEAVFRHLLIAEENGFVLSEVR